MLFATGTTRFGSGTLRSKLLLERRMCAHVVERNGLVFDARFVPAAAGSASNAIVYLVLEGRFEIFGPDATTLVGPAAFVLEEDEFEGCGGARSLLFRSWGDPFAAIELRVAAKDVWLDRGRWRRWEMDAPCLASARAVRANQEADQASTMRALLSDLGRLGVIDPAIGAGVGGGDLRFDRIWAALRPMAERFHVLPTLDEVSATSGLSLRQLARELAGFAETFRFAAGGWRDATRRLRLKLALLGLSADDISVGSVARAVGYGSVDAMARAFRDAGLPPPGEVRAVLRDR